MSKIDVICDCSHQKLEEIPQRVLQMCNLKMLYLEANAIQRLPEDFFTKLPKLSWLDLRNNRLKTVPKSIANHECLENLLLADNNIEELPNEIGLVPNLKALLISGNPLVYPPSNVVEQGTEEICKYLKEEYVKLHPVILEERNENTEVTMNEETKPKKTKRKSKDKIPVRELLRKSSKMRNSIHSGLVPVISVKSLSKMEQDKTEESPSYTKPVKKIHKLSKCCSKVSLHSHCTSFIINKRIRSTVGKIEDKSKSQDDRIDEQELKEAWMSKLKDLLNDQNKILQQERNLRALSQWRLEKKTEPLRPLTSKKPSDVPYGTDPAYNTMLSRMELTNQIDKMIRNIEKPPNRSPDVKNLIEEVVGQLKELENQCSEAASPRTEMEHAGRQIQAILELNKKIAKIQILNDRF